MPCRHDQMLPVVCRILASLSHCWFVCFLTLFILSKHGTKANIRSTKMANIRHAYNRDVLQSYWTSDGLPLYRSANSGRILSLLDLILADFRRFLTVLIDRLLFGSQCCLSTGLDANGIHHQCERLAKMRQTTGNF
jgi:hypothetical protein